MLKFDLQLFDEEETPPEETVETTETQEETPTPETTETKEGKGDDPTSTAESAEPSANEAVEYKLEVPEGFSVPMKEFTDLAKETNLPNETAQKMVDFYTKTLVPKMEAERQAEIDSWVKASNKTFGDEGINQAKEGLNRFATPELKQLLDETGLGNHPVVIGLFKSINEKISEGSLVSAKATSKPKTLSDIWR